MGNIRTFVPILLSILIALAGSYYLYQWVKQKTSPDKVVTVTESKAIPVVVAKAGIPWGVKLIPEMLTTTPYLEESLPIGSFSKPGDIVDRIVVSTLREGEPVLEHRLAPTSMKTGGVAAILESGKRAVSVKGNNVLGIAGFINPGNRVDVLVTIEDPDKDMDVTKIVLENILVLASGRQIQENGKGEAAPVDVYTLEVTPDQGERLTLAATKGRLQFALRGATDSDIVLTKGVTVPEMLKSLLIVDANPGKPAVSSVGSSTKRNYRKIKYIAPKKSNKATIEIIKGLSLTRKEITL
ncbi:Flp pilus assembly protein CpaB [Desulfobacula phenolica]|uniref:Pilus assembly protein CpaB n=1 Tax=Desulfobacula phenolica TaxID=90732 RepID=A0A1H2ERI1_9BACT|nr:Flp pilus assembly protein CpaB [Desulfobacula phenolica]SDT97792.1 pilus assembly protein CpaB [Desulfobacula phenolica]